MNFRTFDGLRKEVCRYLHSQQVPEEEIVATLEVLAKGIEERGLYKSDEIDRKTWGINEPNYPAVRPS